MLDIVQYPAIRNAYVECALWASTDDDGEPLDGTYNASDIAEDALDTLHLDVINFVQACEAERPDVFDEIDPGQIGHDFWLTRNRHGAGFWDRGWGERGEWLTKQCRPWGSSDLYVGDDGRVHVQ